MAKPFDVTMKYLVESAPADWLQLAGFKSDFVELIDADLATVTASADKVLKVLLPEPWLLQLEFQASRDRDIGERLLHYSVLLSHRHRLPVHSVVVLLRQEADSVGITGVVRKSLPEADTYLSFEYQVLRLWNEPAERFLEGGLGTLPLAPLAAVKADELASIIGRMKTRTSREASPEEANQLWTSAYLLMGLKYSRDTIDTLLQGVRNMRESTTYQAILEEGEARGEARGEAVEARKILLRLGAKRFGAPTAKIRSRLASIVKVEVLDSLIDRLLDVESWSELLPNE